MGSKNAEWMKRASRRKNLELSMHQTQTCASKQDALSISTSAEPPRRKGSESYYNPTEPLRRKGSESYYSLIEPLRRKGSESFYAPSRSHSTYSAASVNNPSSPSGSVQSTAASSLSANTECADQLLALQQKLRSNTAQIEANEAQMRALDAVDEQVSTGIQQRLKAVQGLNDRLIHMRMMLARVEDLSRGNF